MFSRVHFERLALLTLSATLAACSSGVQTTPVPGVANATTNQSSVRMTKHARALAADCSATTALATVGLCTNIELAGPVYGPSTPAQQVPGYHPSDLRAAYALPSTTAGKGQTIGIVIVNDDPNAESDLAVYRSTFGLPACTSASGCLHVLTANKATPDKTWAREAATDLDMASAVCPNCKLILYEANSSKDSDLAAAVTAVIAAGATVVSNSYVVPESSKESSGAWSHPGVPVLAAAGDLGPGPANWPAAATSVIAVGGTTLTADPTAPRGWRESVWAGTGSGCSAIAARPAWQSGAVCPMRSTADVAAVGDPSTPVAIYDSYQDTGWLQVGGTSVSTPIVAGVYALAGNGAQMSGAASLYAARGALFPIAGGSAAGLGSPNGIAAF